MLPTSVGIEPATSWSPVRRRIQLSHGGRPVFTKARYSGHCSSSLCLKPCQASSALRSPGRTSKRMTFLSSLNHLRNMSGGSWLKGSNGGEWAESKCRKDKDHDLRYRPRPPAEFRRVSWAVCCTGVGSNSIFCKGCKHWVHKKCSGLKRLTEDPDYRCTWCQGTACPFDRRPQRKVQVGPDKPEAAKGGIFLLLPKETCSQKPLAVNFQPQHV